MKLKPVNIDDVRNSDNPYIAKRLWLEYMERARQQDKINIKIIDNMKPEVKAKRREYNRERYKKPEVKAKKREYNRKYYQNKKAKSEVKE